MQPIIPFRNRIIPPFIVLFLFSSFIFSQEPFLYSNPEESLGLLDQAFQDNEASYLDNISSDQFCNSRTYFWIKSLLNSNFLSLGYRNETIEKEFLIKDKLQKLVVLFDRDNLSRTWSVSDVFLKDDDEILPIKAASFSPLSYANHFDDFLLAIKEKKLKYFGIGPQGKININALDSLELKLSNKTTITYKNIIVHDGKKPVGFIYVVLKDYPCTTEDGKCGWLIEKVGSMQEMYKNDFFVQFLLDPSNYPDIESPNMLTRSFNFSYLQDRTLFENPEASINLLLEESPGFERSFHINKEKEVKPVTKLNIYPKRQEEE